MIRAEAGLAAVLLIFLVASPAADARTPTPPLDIPLPTNLSAIDLLGTTSESGDFAGIVPGAAACETASHRPISLPRDDAPHNQTYLEWWWWHGSVVTPSGRRFAFTVTFASKPWANLYGSDYSLTDERRSEFHYDREPVIVGRPTVTTDGFELTGKQVSAVGGNGRDRLRFEVDGYELNLKVRPSKAPVRHLEDGYFTAFCNNINFYSRMRMRAIGSLSKAGKTYPVKGTNVFDHVWGFSPATELASWDWMNIELDDGRDLFLIIVRAVRAGEPLSLYTGSISSRRGRVRTLHRGDFSMTPTRFWRRDATCSYPVEWDARVKDMRLSIRAALDETEVRALEHPAAFTLWPTYSDGETVVSGDAKGRGWLDMKYCVLLMRHRVLGEALLLGTVLCIALLALAEVVAASPSDEGLPLGLRLPSDPSPADVLGRGAGDGRSVLPGSELCRTAPHADISLPADHAPHNDTYLEWYWWYGPTSQPQRASLRLSPAVGVQAVGPHSAGPVLDHRHLKRNLSRRGRPGAGKAASRGRDRVRSRRDSSVRTRGGRDRIQFEVDGAQLSLRLDTIKPHVISGWHSIYCNDIFVYSRVRMPTTGTLTRNGRTTELRGSSHFDHSWGFTPAYLVGPISSLGFELNDGRDIWVGVVHLGDVYRYEIGYISNRRGKVRLLHRQDIELTPTAYWNADGGCRYPVEWDVEVKGERLHARAAVKSTEIQTTDLKVLALWPEWPRIWDGPTVVTGDARGRGWLDMTHYCGVR